jgi:16S rRNA pseudouridine516 synthase
MRAEQLLFSQGFGVRKQCQHLIARGSFSIGGKIIRAVDFEIDPQDLFFEVDGVAWPYHAHAYLMLNKPAGVECSHKPSHWPSVYSLLPSALNQRPVKGGQNGVQAVGRLDQDTTGLLLLSDDGQFIHRMNSPKHHVPKTYSITTAEPLSASQVQQLIDDVQLKDELAPVRAAACMQTGEYALSLTLTEGKYHQVKRMIAAVGNHVEALHRSQVGGLRLPADLAPGQWRWLSLEALTLLR